MPGARKMRLNGFVIFASNPSTGYSTLLLQGSPQTSDSLSAYPKSKIDRVSVDAGFLPFKDESLRAVFCYHVIETEEEPVLLLQEVCRVTKRKVVFRYHPSQRTDKVSLNEAWFNKESEALGLEITQFPISYENRTLSKFGLMTGEKSQNTLSARGLRRLERGFLKRFRVATEVEAWLVKQHQCTAPNNLRFVVVFNNLETFKKSFAKSRHVNLDRVKAYHNVDNEPLPKFYNEAVRKHMKENVWFIFCHQDFVLKEDLPKRLEGKDTEAIYGPIGGRPVADTLIGEITQRDGTTIGKKLEKDAPVQTLDEMCLIVHSSIFKQDLLFDEAFRFHFYGADFCMQAHLSGFDVIAMQLNCQHESRTIHGDRASAEYLSSREVFKEKWRSFLPVRTTTTLMKEKEP